MDHIIKNIPTENEINKILNSFENIDKNSVDFKKIELDILKVIAFIIFNYEKNKEYTKNKFMNKATLLILSSFDELKKYNEDLFTLCLEVVNLYDEAGIYDVESLKNTFFEYLYKNKKAKDFFLGM